MHKSTSNKGFTLVELSIVIVIIALIVAGIAAGNSLVKQAKIRQSITQLTNYKTAINTFKLTYNYLPGDMPTAFNFWGTPGACTNTQSSVSAHAGCNGNGDRTIDWDGEQQRLWQHLYLAKLTNKSYTGVKGALTFTAGVDSPLFYGESPGIEVLYAGNNGDKTGINWIGTNAMSADGVGWNIATHYAATAQNIDAKLDDGIADKGKVQSDPTPNRYSNYNQQVTCYSAGGVYNIGNTTEPVCTILMFF